MQEDKGRGWCLGGKVEHGTHVKGQPPVEKLVLYGIFLEDVAIHEQSSHDG